MDGMVCGADCLLALEQEIHAARKLSGVVDLHSGLESVDCCSTAQCLLPVGIQRHAANEHVGVEDLSSDGGIHTPQCLLEEGRKQLSRWYGSACLFLLAASCVGFMPAEYYGFSTGQFFFDALRDMELRDTYLVKIRSPHAWHWFVVLHILSANAWVLLALVQVSTGAFGGKRLKQYHRNCGYIAVTVAIIFNFVAISLQLVKRASWDSNVMIIGNTTCILTNMAIGILAARSKDIALHKQAMAWTCAWTAIPGGVRLSRYVLSSIGEQSQYSLTNVKGYIAGSTALMLLAMLPAVLATFSASFSTRLSRWVCVINFGLCAGGGLADLLSPTSAMVQVPPA
jgi:hypothetical protein